MPPERTPRREALAGAGTTVSLLAATVGGALVVAGLLGAGAFPGGPDAGSAAPLRIAAPPVRERVASIVLPSAPVARAHRRTTARERAHRATPQASRPSATQAGSPAPPATAATHTSPPAHPTSQSPPPPAATAPPPSVAAPGGPLAPAADATREAGATAAGAAQPASPTLGGAVGAADDTAAGVLQQAGDAVATLTDPGR
jgi:hypothetical protein